MSSRMLPIRMREIASIIEAKDGEGKGIPFSGKVFKKNGELMVLKDVICTSSYHGGTYNLMFPNGQIRKVKGLFFIEINGREVMI
ncbi:MAG: hypothetical protein LUE98_04505 [Tannerellaceae bacterium]|nr:hypothetical protein [Tannerellaceae bacterium]